MKYLEFNLLAEMDKMRELWSNGVLIAERKEGHYRYELFQIGDFYAEQQVHIHYNVRKSLQTFKSVALLEPYLEKIDISSLLKEYK